MKSTIATAGILIGMLAMPVMADDMQGNPASQDRGATEAVRENVSDATITAKINAEFAKDRQVSALNINVDTDDGGNVTLRGQAGSTAEADRAAALARSVKGVTSVTNNIEVR